MRVSIVSLNVLRKRLIAQSLIATASMIVGLIVLSIVAPLETAKNTPEAIDLSALLHGDEIAVVQQANFVAPVDHKEEAYIEMRAAAYQLTDAEVLRAYQNGWLDVAEFKNNAGGFALNRASADAQAMQMHAYWREIQQRGLAPQVFAPEFESVWSFLLIDTKELENVTL